PTEGQGCDGKSPDVLDVCFGASSPTWWWWGSAARARRRRWPRGRPARRWSCWRRPGPAAAPPPSPPGPSGPIADPAAAVRYLGRLADGATPEDVLRAYVDGLGPRWAG